MREVIHGGRLIRHRDGHWTPQRPAESVRNSDASPQLLHQTASHNMPFLWDRSLRGSICAAVGIPIPGPGAYLGK